ncbi:MAG: efflux RND transporter permease subunit [Trueperaceae bacterium]|nr:efflux RND transporter permease subunit [Trueperaceae bacterium]
MNPIVNFFVKRYVFAISVFLALGIFGLVLGSRLGVNILPNFELSFVAVTTTYPGAGAEEVAKQVSEPIEDALSTLNGVKSLSSTSFEGVSVVFLEFNAGINADQAAVDVSQRVNAIAGTLPSDASSPSVQKADPNAEPILFVAITAPGEDLRSIQSYAENVLEAKLRSAEGVADVSLVGALNREVQVLLDPGKLELYNLTPLQIAGAIGASSLNVPLGDLTIAGERILFTGRNDPKTLRDVETMTIDPLRGLRVSDVAIVRDASADVTAYSRLDGEPVVLLSVQKQSGKNTVATADDVRRILKRNEASLPQGYSARVVGDTSPSIRRTVQDTLREVVIATFIVSIIVLLFIGRLGSVFAVVVAIPICIAGAMILFGLAGFTLNIVTLVAIIVSIGLVVDDSIVVAEAVDRYREHGYDRMQSVLRGAGEVSVPVLATTLALMAVFLPISILPGILGQFFREFGLTLAATILASYMEALFFLTVRLAYSPDPFPPDWKDAGQAAKRFGKDVKFTVQKMWRRWWYWFFYLLAVGGLAASLFGPRTPFDFNAQQRIAGMIIGGLALLFLVALSILIVGFILRLVLSVLGAISRSSFNLVNVLTNNLTKGYVKALNWALDHSIITLIIAGLTFLSIFPIAPNLGFTFAPASDSGLVGITLRLPTGTALATTNNLAAQVEDLLAGRPEIDALQVTVGVNSGDVGSTAASERAEFTVELVPGSERSKTNAELAIDYEREIKDLLSAYPEAQISAAAQAGGGPPPVDDYSITLSSNNLDLLKERDSLARATLEDVTYMSNIRSGFDTSVSERVFKLEPTKLVGTGLTIQDVYTTLRAYNVGLEAASLSSGGEDVPIKVRINPTNLRDEQALLSLPIYSQVLGRGIPISELGSFVIQQAPTSISRIDQTYTSTISAKLLPGAPPTSKLRGEVKDKLLAAGVFDDQVIEGRGVGLDLTGDLIFLTPIAFALALLLNYLVIASQFNSFKLPVYLLLAVPLALVGALWVFFITGTPLDLFAVLGIIILPGLVVKNSILLLDLVINKEHYHDMTLKQMLIEAARTRLRPILMTTLTLIAISLPILLGTGEGAELRYSLGLVIFGGVTFSALLTLFVIPTAFYRFERKKFEAAEEKQSRPEANPKLGNLATSTD